MRLVDRLLGRDPEPEPAPPAPDPAAEVAQRDAERLRQTARDLGEINPSDAKYW